MKNIYGGYSIYVEGLRVALAVGITNVDDAIGAAKVISLMRPHRKHYIADSTGDIVAEVKDSHAVSVTYCVVNGNAGSNISKKNTRAAAENSAMRWRQRLKALDIPVYVMNSLTGEIVYEAL